MKIIWEKTVNKLTTEQLLFAHRIGAELVDIEPPILFYKMEGDKWYYNNLSCDDYSPSIYDNPDYECAAKPIDFSPLYDWIDHNGGECPVRGDDAVIVDFNEKCGGLYYEHAKGIDWKKVKIFKLTQRLSEWPEQRAIGQNGNTGEYYEEQPETMHATAHHKRQGGTDLIDDWWNDYQPEIARILMWEQVRKYKNRLGKKDPVHIEVSKMADYLRRWAEKELELASKSED